MIRIPVSPSLSTIHLFTTPLERELLEEMATESDGWVKGRQEIRRPTGAAYFKLDIKEQVEQGLMDDDMWWLSAIAERALDEIRQFTKVGELGDNWDAYLLYVPAGVGLAEHSDPVEEDFQHVRLNAMVEGSAEMDFMGHAPSYGITPGGALIFRADQAHALGGFAAARLLFSVGASVKV